MQESGGNAVPAGCMEDTQGRFVPVSQIKPIDLERDRLVHEIVAEARNLAGSIAAFKAKAMGNIQAFVDLSAEQYQAKLGGKKGNVSLLSFNGAFRVVRAIDERITFDERLQAAKALIDECITEWAEGTRAELRTLINDAFQVDRSGKINTQRVLSLRRMDIADVRWQWAMQAIGDSVQVVSTKSYIRIYVRGHDGSTCRCRWM